jgi:hypothetical protein
LDFAQAEDDPLRALDAGALEVGPELGNQSLDPEIGKATDPEVSASIRVTEDARKRLAGGRVDDAMRDLARAVSLDPSNGFAYYYLGRAFLARKDYAQAGIFFRWAETAFSGRSDWSAEAFSYGPQGPRAVAGAQGPDRQSVLKGEAAQTHELPATALDWSDRSIEVVETAEQALVSKTARIVEEVAL